MVPKPQLQLTTVLLALPDLEESCLFSEQAELPLYVTTAPSKAVTHLFIPYNCYHYNTKVDQPKVTRQTRGSTRPRIFRFSSPVHLHQHQHPPCKSSSEALNATEEGTESATTTYR